MKKLFLKSLALIMMLTMSVSTWATDYCGELVQSTVDNTTVGIGVTIKRVSGTNNLLVQFESDKISGVRAGGTFQQWGNGVWQNQADAVANFASGWTQTGNVFSKEFEFSTFPTAGNGQIYVLFDLQNAGAPPVAGFTLTNINFEPECVVAPVASTWEAADVNIAKNTPVFISARWGGDKANAVDDNVNDDNVQLQVTTAQPTEWLVLDLGANVDIEKFSLTTKGDRKDKKFAICTAPAQASAPEFADGTDALAGVWKEEWIFDEEYENTGRTTLTYSVEWKNVRYIKYQATERNHGDQYGTAICEFRVKCAATKAVTGVTLDQTIASIPANKTLTLKATVAPADAANKNVIWISSDETIAKVVDGVVTPQTTTGPVTITARTEDGGFEATCAVTVLPAQATAPSTAAPVPTVDAAKVMSIYSDTYTPCVDMSNINILNQGWWDNPSMTQEEIEGNHMLHYYGRMTGMIGWEHAHVNIGTMNKVHVDIWAQENGTLTMGPTSANPTVVAKRELTLVGQQWNSFDLDLASDFDKTLDLSDMFQNQFTGYSAQENLFVDNYFYYTTLDIDTEKPVMTAASLASASFTSAVLNVAATDNRGVTKYIVKNGETEVGKFTPAEGKITVTGLTDGTAYNLSIYAQDGAENVSDNKVDVELTTLAMPSAAPAPVTTGKEAMALYSDVVSVVVAHGFNHNTWGGAPATEIEKSGEHYLFYNTSATNWTAWGADNDGGDAIVGDGEVRGTKGGVNASGMEFLHIDIWSMQACPSFEVFINDSKLAGAALAATGWQSFDLPLSSYPAAPARDWGLDNVNWMKFVGINGVANIAIDNVYFWKASADAPKQVSATVNIAEAGTAVVKQNGEVVTEVANGTDADFIAEANDGYLFLGWYKGSELQSTNAIYTVENIQANTTLQAKFRALNNIYCHTELTSAAGGKVIYLTMKRTAENQYQVIIDSEEEMKSFGNAFIGGINGGSQIKLNDADIMAQYVTISPDQHRITINVESTTPIKWNTPVYINMPTTEYRFENPWNKTVEYEVACEAVPVETVTLNKTTANVGLNDQITLIATVAPLAAENHSVTWKTSDDAVATVVNGVVTGLTEGEAIITATSVADETKFATCTVTVVAPYAKTCWGTGQDGALELVYSITHNLDGTLTFTAETSGGNPTVHQVNIADVWNTMSNNEGVWSWTSTDTYESGTKVKGFFYFPARIDFTYFVGDECERPIIEVTDVTLSETAITLLPNETHQLTASVVPSNATDKAITWTTDNADVATVVNGLVTAGTITGTANITATSTNGKTATCAVTVENITEKTWWGTAYDKNMSIRYSVTRNENKTLTYSVEMAGTYGGVRQINDGDWHTLTNNEGVWSWTTEATYNTGDHISAFWYFPERFNFTYTVGSENERPEAIIASIGNTTYATVAEFATAFNAVEGETSASVYTDMDLATALTLKNTADIVLNLNGKTIKNEASKTLAQLITVNGKLTIDDKATTGKIQNTASGKYTLKTGTAASVLTLKNGTIETTTGNSNGAVYATNGAFVMTGGKVIAAGTGVTSKNVTISGGEIAATAGQALCAAGTISGGTFKSTNSFAVYANQSGTLEITGGEFTGVDTKPTISLYTTDVKVTGATLNNGVGFASNATGLLLAGTDEAYLAATHAAFYNGETLVGYAPINTGLLASAKVSGKTVKLTKNVATTTYLNVTKSFTLDLNGYDIACTPAKADAAILAKGTQSTPVELTITGEGKVSCADHGEGCNAIQVSNCATVNIEGGEFSVPGDNSTIYIVTTADSEAAKSVVNISGGEFKSGDGKFVLNIKDNVRTYNKFVVTGGTFYGFNPSDNTAEGAGTNFCAEGYTGVETSANVFEVLPVEPIRDGLTVGKMGTICYGYGLKEIEGATFYEPVAYDGMYITFDEATEVKAGYGYMFVAEATEITAVKFGETELTEAITGAPNHMQGILEDDDKNLPEGRDYCGIKNGHWQFFGAYNTMTAGHAYIVLTDLPSEVGQPNPSRRRLVVSSADNTAVVTGLDFSDLDAEVATKVLRDGQLYIIREGKMYNVQGAVVK